MEGTKSNNKENNILTFVKSKYILKRIFNNLQKNIFLNIIRYNNRLKNILNLDTKDYKDFLKIEIDIIPLKSEYGAFMYAHNLDQSFYHIYINDNKEEIKRDYIKSSDGAKKIKIVLDYEIKSLFELFLYAYCVEKVNFIKFNRKDIINMGSMFKGCSNLKEINLSNFNTNKVTNMAKMFHECKSLKKNKSF